MTDRDEVRDQIAHAMGWTTGHFGDVLDAVMAVVDPIVAERDDARARKQDDLDALKKRCGIQLRTIDAHITLRDELKAQLARAEFAGGLATEKVEDLYAAAGLPYDEPFDDAVEKLRLLRWLHAEAVWQRDEAARSARDSAAYAELGWTATEQLRVALSTERKSRFRWAEEAARLQAEVDRAFVFPHDWQEQIATEGTSCCGDSEAVIELLTNWRVDQFRKDAQKEPSDAQ